MESAIKIMDSKTGSVSFFCSITILEYKLVILGVPNSNIKVFFHDQYNGFFGFYLKVNCLDWNGASLKLQSKTNHVDDIYSDTGDIFYKDSLVDFKYT